MDRFALQALQVMSDNEATMAKRRMRSFEASDEVDALLNAAKREGFVLTIIINRALAKALPRLMRRRTVV